MPLEKILKNIIERNGEPCLITDMAAEINAKKLLKNENNIPVSSAQILEYAKDHPEYFSVLDNKVSLKKFPLNEDLANNDIDSLLKSYFNRIAVYSDDNEQLYTQLCFAFIVAIIIRHLDKEDMIPGKYKPESTYADNNIFETAELFSDYMKKINKQGIYKGLFDDVLKEKTTIINILPLLYKLNICLKSTGYNNFVDRFDAVYLKHANKHDLPKYIYHLLAALCSFKGNESVYDPASNKGYLAVYASKENDNGKIFVQDHDEIMVKITRLNLILHACFSFNTFKGDSLLKPGVFSNKMDYVISVPPAGYNVKHTEKHKYPFNNIARGNKIEELYLQMMISRLNYRGKMIAVIPDDFLYRESSISVRRMLLDDDILETVVKLPSAAFKENGNYSVLMINKSKRINRKRKVFFVNLSRMPFNEDNTGSNAILKEKAFLQIIALLSGAEEEPLSWARSKWVSIKEIKEERSDLSTIRYTHPVKDKIEEAKCSGEQMVKLEQITKFPINPKRKDNKAVYYITSESLNDDVLDVYLDVEHIPFKKDLPALASQIDVSALLLSANSSTLRPTFFDYKGTPIFISKDVYALVVDQSRVDIEYLIFQLDSEMVRQQLEIIKHEGTGGKAALNDIRGINIILPSIAEQINKAGEFKDRLSGNYLLTRFINDIKMVTNNHDVKIEIERFARNNLKNAGYIEFRTSLEFDTFPFTEDDIRNHQYIKYADESHYTFVLLINNEQVINGVLLIDSHIKIDTKSYAEINTYASFLVQLKEHITKKVANDNMARFAHTSKNFFSGIQGELHALLQSENDNLVEALKTNYTDDEQFIEYKIKKDNASRDDFIAFNKLCGIKEKIASLSSFYLKTDKNFKNIVNSEPEHFNIITVIKSLYQIVGNFELSSRKEEIIVYAKSEAIKHSLIDLVQNAQMYSPDNKCKVIVKNKSGYAYLQIENSVSETISEERYNKLGREWVRKDGESLGSGIYWAYQVVEDSYGHIELGDYNTYLKDKVFIVKIRLRK